jgi:hypothetical protein
MQIRRFEYMRWAKDHEAHKLRYPLARSGMEDVVEIPSAWLQDGLYLQPPLPYSSGDFGKRLAERYGISPDQVFVTAGTSLANYQVFATLLQPGDPVLVEQPCYEALLRLPSCFGASVLRLPRRRENSFQPDPEELRSILQAQRPRLVVITQLHNPSGVAITDDLGRQLAELCAEVEATLLVDEVYREFWRPATTSLHWGRNVVTTSSLTKAYGLSGLRLGWVFAEPTFIERLWDLMDLMQVLCPAPSLALGSRFLAAPEVLQDRVTASQLRCLPALLEALREFPQLGLVQPDGGLVAFPWLRGANDSTAVVAALADQQISVVPGSFFEMPEHFRISCALASDDLQLALQAMRKGLAQFFAGGR